MPTSPTSPAGALVAASFAAQLMLLPAAVSAQQPSAPTVPPAAEAPANPSGNPPANPAANPTANPAANPPSPAPANPNASTGTPAVVLNGEQVESIMGKKIRSSRGEDMGRIVDLIVDKTGQIRAAIIDFGGFLGVGTRQIAVDWNSLRFPSDPKADALAVDLTRDQLKGAPAYKPGEQIVVLGQQPRTAPAADAAAQAGTPARPQ